MKFFVALLAGFMLLNAGSAAQDTVDVTEQGISDGVRNSKQQDRDETIMDAKLKAIEKAGAALGV